MASLPQKWQQLPESSGYNMAQAYSFTQSGIFMWHTAEEYQ